MYVIVNYVTYERKAFSRFEDLRDFYRHLSIEENSQWSGWQFIE